MLLQDQRLDSGIQNVLKDNTMPEITFNAVWLKTMVNNAAMLFRPWVPGRFGEKKLLWYFYYYFAFIPYPDILP